MKAAVKRGLLLILFMLITVTFVWAQEPLSSLEGLKPYTPNRLEWLALGMNASCREDLMVNNYSIDFIPLVDKDTILIYVRYLPTVNREIMNRAIETVKEVVSMTAESYGWSSWLKVKEDVAMHREKPEK